MTSEVESSNGRPSIPDNEIIERFGGIRPMASKLGVAVTTVQGWKERGHIPAGRLSQIVEAAAAHGVDIGLEATPAPAPVKLPPPMMPETKAMEEQKPEEMESEPVPGPEPTPQPQPAPAPVQETKPAEPAAVAPPRPAGGTSWLALVIVVVLLGGAILTRPFWESRLYTGGGAGLAPAGAGRLDEIAAGLAAIEDSMTTLRRDLDTRERGLSGRVDALEAGGGETGAAFAEQLVAIEQGMKDIAGKMDALDAGLSGIESRIAGLEANEGELRESVKTSQQAADATLGELDRSVRALEDGLASVGGVTGDLEGRVTELETRPLQTGEKIAAMVLALGQVEAAMNSGKPYRAALERLEDLARDDPMILESEALAALSPWADYGIPDRLTLRRKFAELTPAIDRALSGAEDGTWLESVWSGVTGLITIRKIDGSDPAPIGQAERALDDGDLVAAATALEGNGSLGLDGDAWLNLVKARIAAEHEIDALYGQTIAPLAGARGGGGAATQ